MADASVILALLSLAIWLVLFFGRGDFWKADQRLAPELPSSGTSFSVRVASVVPARDEEDSIGRALGSLLAQTGVTLTTVLVDDHSRDRTRAIAEELVAGSDGRLVVTGTAPLPPGWSGKLWALDEGIRRAELAVPDTDHLLLTDADIELGPDTVRRLLAKAVRDDLDLVSLMVELDHRGPWARLLIPAFVFFFQKLYPFRWVNDPRRGTAAAAGGCVLVRRTALERIGGIAAIRGALIDDCALAAAVKRSGGRIWLGLADSAWSLRDNRSLSSVWSMVARTAYTQLDHAPLQLIGAMLGMAVTYLVPPLAVLTWPLHGSTVAALAGAAAWALMAVSFRPTLRLYGQPAALGALLPLAGLLYSLMTLDSAIRHWRGRGGRWKGRTYPAPDRPSA